MRTGRGVMRRVLPEDLELHDRALLVAVGEVAALAGDAVRLPVVRARGVEPELGEVEELRLEAERAAVLLRPPDGVGVEHAEHAAGALRPRLADVDPDLSPALHTHLEGGRPAGGHGGA